jgi:surface polysaccharide O-acyltransferase-like enzyme
MPSLSVLLRRLPVWTLLLPLLATLFLVLPTGVLDRVDTYQATIRPLARADASVIVLFYSDRFDRYRRTGALVVPPTGWKVTRNPEFVRLDAQPKAAPLRFVADGADDPLYVSLIRHAGGGTAMLENSQGEARVFNLRGRAESIVSFTIGGPRSATPPSEWRWKNDPQDSLLLALATYLLFLLVAIRERRAARAWSDPAAVGAAAARRTWADLARVLAIFGVIVIHTCSPAFYQFGADWLWPTFLDSIVRCAVPLFVMLSGALLIGGGPVGQPAGPRQILQRVRRVLLPLLAWNVIYLLYVAYYAERMPDWTSMLRQTPMYHLWFAYMIIGLYVMLPVLLALYNVVRDRRDLQAYLLALWMVITSLPLYTPVPLLGLLQQASFLGYGGYFVLGAMLASKPPGGSSARWGAVFALAVAATFVFTWSQSEQAGQPVETAFNYFSLNVFLASVAAFVLLSRCQPRGRAAAVLQWASDRSFLVFFMHVVILERLGNFMLAADPGLAAPLRLLFVAAATFVACLAVSALLRQIPRAREVLG